jgi:hypothetical protein
MNRHERRKAKGEARRVDKNGTSGAQKIHRESQMTREEVARLEQLLDETDPDQDSVDDTIRRFMEELPHLTTEDIAEVIMARAETTRMETAEQSAAVEGEKQILEIILETERMSGTADLTVGMVFQILADRAAQGDEHAADLLDKFDQAIRLVGLTSD